MRRRAEDPRLLAPTAKIPLILERLGTRYEIPSHARPLPPLDGLVLTILSQHTSDVNSDRALAQLQARYPTWEEVLAAPQSEVADAIRSGGLADVKSGRIHEVLQRIQADRGKLDLEFLRDLPVEEAKQYLLSLPGVGRKTAAVLLLFRFNKPVFPVDTHVHRVSGRLGLIPEKMPVDRAHDVFDAMLRPEQMFPLHVGLIMHGRRTCLAQRPRCAACALLDLCPQVGVAGGNGRAEQPAPRPGRARP